MRLTTQRIGNFTSSGIAALMSNGKQRDTFGKAALTYIAEKRMERRLQRSLNSETTARPTSWGNLVESRVFDLLGLDYKLCSKDTLIHPKFDFWSGSPDGEKFDEGKTVYDIKCPFTLKSFCTLADCKNPEQLINEHKEGETYFWQLVSNAILTGAKYAELISYVPYKKELAEIKEMANNFDGNQNKIAWINWAEDEDLPYLNEGMYYKNLNIMRFQVTDLMKQQLTDRVVMAGELLTI